MKPLQAITTLLGLFSATHLSAQTKVTSYEKLQNEIIDVVISTDKIPSHVLVTDKGLNKFIQKKVSVYLTGSSEISLSKMYSTYTADNDKLTFGINVPKYKKETSRLISLLTPLVETNIKNNFATLYKKGEWQADIRVGFKYSYLFPCSSIKFYNMDGGKDQKSKMVRKRNVALRAILEKIKKDSTAYNDSNNAQMVNSKEALEATIIHERDSLNGLDSRNKKNNERLEYLEKVKNHISALPANEKPAFDKMLDQYSDEIAKAEVDALYESNAYTLLKTYWMSFWGFLPLSDRKTYIASNYLQPFSHDRFKPWEINAQFNYLREGQIGSIFFTAGYKLFQNNSALADLMTQVDYNRYFQFPMAVDTSNAAILETNKAYIGNYDEFVTNHINLQLVLSLPDRKKKGGEKFLTPGISIRFEKNFGDFGAVNWNFGLPLRFRGKDKAVNIEPQVRLKNTNNYNNKVDFKVQPVFGINVGLPFAVLFK